MEPIDIRSQSLLERHDAQATARIHVLIADDYSSARRCVAIFHCVAPDLALLGHAATGAESVEVCAKPKPYVVLMDFRMPELAGIAAAPAFREADSWSPSDRGHEVARGQLVPQDFRPEPIGYLLKDVGVTGVHDAIRNAAVGNATPGG